MSRLIDADALIEFWKADFTEEERSKLRIPLNVAIENLSDAPTVPLSIVQCKDCEHWSKYKDDVFGDCTFNHGVTDKYFFCADGERRTE